jgi:protein-disulfide isomerase
MKNFLLTIMSTVIIAVSGTTLAATMTPAAPMTREQGDAILKELREIKALLSKQQQPQVAPPGLVQPERGMPQNLTVKGDAIHVLGKSDAPLTMVEFTDYQCPFCGRFEATTFPEIKKNYIDTGKLRLIVRDLPLEGLHPYALKAAQAAHCAADQGKFWGMHDLLFKNQNKLDADSMNGYATKDLGLKGATFRKCMTDGKHLQEIAAEARYAQSLGITGTPTFIVGKTDGDTVEGRVVVGALPYANFAAVIDEALQKQ